MDEESGYKAKFVAVRKVTLGGGLTLELEQAALADDQHDEEGLLGACTGGTVWAAGEQLAHEIQDNDELRSLVVGRRVLELGSGTGVVGLACAAVGAKSVVLTDLPGVVPLLQRNLRRNNWVRTVHGAETVALELDWRSLKRYELIAALQLGGGLAETIVASECCYHASLVEPLATLISTALKVTSGTAVLGGLKTKHNPVAYSALLSLLKGQHGLDVQRHSCSSSEQQRRQQHDSFEVVVVSQMNPPNHRDDDPNNAHQQQPAS